MNFLGNTWNILVIKSSVNDPGFRYRKDVGHRGGCSGSDWYLNHVSKCANKTYLIRLFNNPAIPRAKYMEEA